MPALAGGAGRLLAVLAVVVVIFVFLGPPLIRQFQRLFEAIPGWLDSLNGLLADLEAWLASHNIDVNLQINTSDIVDWLQTHGAQSVGTLSAWAGAWSARSSTCS